MTTTEDRTCIQCHRPAMALDQRHRYWCQECIEASLYCVSCGRFKQDCQGCELLPLPVCCRICGAELTSDEPGCSNCDMIDAAVEAFERDSETGYWLTL